MSKTEWRNVARGDKTIQQEFPIGYAPMCCIICGDVIGGEFKDLENHYRERHETTPLQTFFCSYCKKSNKTAVKRNQHERRCKDKPPDERLPLLNHA